MEYGIALEISATEKQAEQIMIETFKKAHEQNVPVHKNPSLCIAIIKLLIQIAHCKLNNNNGNPNFSIKLFENSPLCTH